MSSAYTEQEWPSTWWKRGSMVRGSDPLEWGYLLAALTATVTGLSVELRFPTIEKIHEELCDGAVAGLQMPASHPLVW